MPGRQSIPLLLVVDNFEQVLDAAPIRPSCSSFNGPSPYDRSSAFVPGIDGSQP
jgi:hypothetical protein